MKRSREPGGTNLANRLRLGWAAAAIALLTMSSTRLAAQKDGPAASLESGDPMQISPKQWATDASLNELKALDYGHSYLRYRIHSRDAKGDQVRDVIQSKDGAVARLIMKEGRALTPEEDTAEHERLQAMLDSPAAFAKHVKGDATGKRMGSDLIKLMPDAMIFTYTPGQPQRASRTPHADDAPEIVLDFKPNPDWTAPNMTADALTGLEGRAWIDPRTHYLTRMEVKVFRGVNFGFGVFAHIYPGGHLTFEQTRVNDQRWMFTRFTEHVNLRVLVKTLKEDSDIEGSLFAPVPEMSYQQAVHLLLETPLPTP